MPGSGAKTLVNNPFLALLREVKPELDRRIEAAFASELDRHGNLGQEIRLLLEGCRELSLRGGKRLRAALVLAGQKAVERRTTRWDRALNVGVALELLQSYFLIHDDWMDQDATRRGGPSLHAALSKRLRSVHLGASAAILGGDYLAVLSTRLVQEATEGHKRHPRILRAFLDMQLSAILGQQLDVAQLSKQAETIYQLKTASYTVSGPLRLGAELAGASEKTIATLARFSEPLGVAFQLRDDLLNLFGHPKNTGKPFASDLRAGKWTWTVQWALEQGKPKERRAVRAVFGNDRASSRDLKSAVGVLEDCGARAATEAEIKTRCHRALSALEEVRWSSRGLLLLQGAVEALVNRGT